MRTEWGAAAALCSDLGPILRSSHRHLTRSWPGPGRLRLWIALSLSHTSKALGPLALPTAKEEGR